MNPLAAAVVESVRWEELSTGRPGDDAAARLPQALGAIATAGSQEEADAAYWSIDNVLVAEGDLYESTVPGICVLLAMLAGPMTVPGRFRIVEMLVEIAGGQVAQAELDSGNTDLGERCRDTLRDGLWTFYGLLLDADPRVRNHAITLISLIEDRTQVALPVLARLSLRDDDGAVREAARRLVDQVAAEAELS
jgi:hypothetical protein